MRSLILMAALGICFPSAAYAKTTYEPYEAKATIVDGQGGTRTTENGIDYWTSGDPPRRYQVLGIITDTRGTGWMSGDAVGSTKIAKKTKEVGGDAVVILHQGSRIKGYAGGGTMQSYGNNSTAQTYSVPIDERRVIFAVIKYLD